MEGEEKLAGLTTSMDESPAHPRTDATLPPQVTARKVMSKAARLALGAMIGARRPVHDWTPWKDKMRAHKNSIVLLQVYQDPSAHPETHRTCLLSVSADREARVFELGRPVASSGQPQLAQRVSLSPPPQITGTSVLTAACCEMAQLQVVFLRRTDDADTSFLNEDQGPRSLSGAPELPQLPIFTSVPAVLFGGNAKGLIAAWSASDGSMLTCLTCHEGAVTSLASIGGSEGAPGAVVACSSAEADGNADLISASEDGTIRVWHSGVAQGPDCGCCLYVLGFGDQNPVADFQLVCRTFLLCISWDGRLRSIDLVKRCCTDAAQVGACRVLAICCREISAKAVQVFVGTDDAEISSWNVTLTSAVSSISAAHSWKAHSADVTGLALWRNWLISASEDRMIRIWEAASGDFIHEFYGHKAAVGTLLIQDHILWSGSRDWSICSWDMGEVVDQLREQNAMTLVDAECTKYEKEMRMALKAPKKTAKGTQGKAGAKKK